MYHIIKLDKLVKSISTLPILREVNIQDIIEIRRSISQGVYLCKILAQRSNNNKDAIKLYYSKMKENYE